jgi:hypothetical protein
MHLDSFVFDRPDSDNKVAKASELNDLVIEKIIAFLTKMQNDPDNQGLIFDLRGNGGGSAYNGVDIVDLFIDEGIVGYMVRHSKPWLLTDILEDVSEDLIGTTSMVVSKKAKNKGVVYDKPLVILVDEFSASASETTTQALIDYQRAYVVGADTTYGKGFGQIAIALERASKSSISIGGVVATTHYRLLSPAGRDWHGGGIVELDAIFKSAELEEFRKDKLDKANKIPKAERKMALLGDRRSLAVHVSDYEEWYRFEVSPGPIDMDFTLAEDPGYEVTNHELFKQVAADMESDIDSCEEAMADCALQRTSDIFSAFLEKLAEVAPAI